MTARAGTYRNNLSGEMAYQSFVPTPLPPNPPIEMDRELTAVLVGALAVAGGGWLARWVPRHTSAGESRS